MLLDDHDTKYPALYASGADFTMAFDAPCKMTTLRAQNALVALEGLFDQFGAKIKEEVTDNIYKTNFVGEHIYGIPTGYYYGGSGGVIYREDLRAKYNAPRPHLRVAGPA